MPKPLYLSDGSSRGNLKKEMINLFKINENGDLLKPSQILNSSKPDHLNSKIKYIVDIPVIVIKEESKIVNKKKRRVDK